MKGEFDSRLPANTRDEKPAVKKSRLREQPCKKLSREYININKHEHV